MPTRLEAFEIPDYPLATSSTNQPHLPLNLVASDPSICASIGAPDDEELDVNVLCGLTELLESKKRIAIVGARRPIIMAERLIQSLSVGGRRAFSFTTGLLPALYRPFQAHFLARTTPVISQSLRSEGVTIVALPCYPPGHSGLSLANSRSPSMGDNVHSRTMPSDQGKKGGSSRTKPVNETTSHESP